MKKSIRQVYLAFVLIMVLLSGCSLSSTPVPPALTFTLLPPTFPPPPVPTATQKPPTATPNPKSALYVLSQKGVVTRVSLTGETKNILDGASEYGFQFLEHNIYVCDPNHSEILVYDPDGNLLRTVSVPSNVNFIEFTALPDGSFALLSNTDDKVYFIDSTGNLLSTANILDNPDSQWQSLTAIVVGNRLILSEDGQKHVLAFDLDTYKMSIFKDLEGLPDGWLGDITYADGVFYLTTSNTIYKFTDNSDPITVAILPKEAITGIVILDGFAYVSVNVTGEIYKVNITDGTISVVATGLDSPNNLVLGE